jgi:hypothetical protein
VVTEGSVNYCATVDAQSPFAAYKGRQAYIVAAQMSGNRISSAVIGLVAGGKDFAIVTKMCAKYGFDLSTPMLIPPRGFAPTSRRRRKVLLPKT